MPQGPDGSLEVDDVIMGADRACVGADHLGILVDVILGQKQSSNEVGILLMPSLASHGSNDVISSTARLLIRDYSVKTTPAH